MNDERKNPPEAPANLPMSVQNMPPMLYSTYDPPDHAKMAKIVASLQALIRDNVTAFPTLTFAFHDSVGPEEREQFIADVKASRLQPILVDSPRGVEISRMSEMAPVLSPEEHARLTAELKQAARGTAMEFIPGNLPDWQLRFFASIAGVSWPPSGPDEVDKLIVAASANKTTDSPYVVYDEPVDPKSLVNPIPFRPDPEIARLFNEAMAAQSELELPKPAPDPDDGLTWRQRPAQF